MCVYVCVWKRGRKREKERERERERKNLYLSFLYSFWNLNKCVCERERGSKGERAREREREREIYFLHLFFILSETYFHSFFIFIIDITNHTQQLQSTRGSYMCNSAHTCESRHTPCVCHCTSVHANWHTHVDEKQPRSNTRHPWPSLPLPHIYHYTLKYHHIPHRPLPPPLIFTKAASKRFRRCQFTTRRFTHHLVASCNDLSLLVCCTVLHCIALYGTVFHCVHCCTHSAHRVLHSRLWWMRMCVAMCGSELQYVVCSAAQDKHTSLVFQRTTRMQKRKHDTCTKLLSLTTNP